MATVSVIVPTFNRPGYLARALASIRAQTYRDYEAIVINDGGEDVRDLVRLFGDVRLINQAHKGLPAARNTGIREAQGILIAYLDDDDMWLPQHLERLTGWRRQSGCCRLVYSDSYFWQDERRFERLLSVDYSRERLLEHNLTPICSILHDRELIREAGYFDESLPNHEDWDLWLRMSEHTDFRHLKEVTALYSKRTGSDQLSMDLPFMAERKEFIRRRYVEKAVTYGS